MKGKLRYILIAIAVIIVIVIALPFLISVNQFRPTIEQKLSTALGRQVQVGNLSLSILSGSLGADDLSIADDPAFSKSAFLTAKSLNVGVELMPLIFSRALHVTGVTIDKPEVTLIKNPAGRWNFSSLASGSSSKSAAPASSSSSAPSDLVIGKIEMKNGSLILGSTNSPKRATYDDLNFEATNVSLA
ncbi:MAG TPA: AsmA family protein, partial [Candidatus Acidoferrales bacterium]|nr:AsmA family protein [Candidatus Acidoferrales bacterium]